jgi:uncharacterized protein (DUF1499 family)
MSPSRAQAQGPASARPSRVAKIALWLALITLAAVAVGLLGAMTGLLPPLTGFLLFGAAMVLGSILTVIVGLIGIVVTRARPGRPVRPGRKAALQAVGIGGALLVVMAILASRSGRVPPIHDITTNLDDPPRFVAAARAEANQGKSFDYPQGNPETPALQKEAYPDLEPIGLDLPPAEALERARKAAEDLGWTVVEVDPNDGRLEATFTSRIFRFVDDIVVRIRPTASGSIADVRSTSRVGESDLGANAARIRSFREQVTENE